MLYYGSYVYQNRLVKNGLYTIVQMFVISKICFNVLKQVSYAHHIS